MGGLVARAPPRDGQIEMAPARAPRTRRERDAGRREIRNAEQRNVLVEVEIGILWILGILGVLGVDRLGGVGVALFRFIEIDVGQVCCGTR